MFFVNLHFCYELLSTITLIDRKTDNIDNIPWDLKSVFTRPEMKSAQNEI